MFLADRKDHVENVIIPELNKGNIIILDRYKYATVCYQHLQGFDINMLVKRNDFPAPDIAFIINAKYHILKNRIKQRNIKLEIFETDDFLKKSIDLYKKMGEFFPKEFFIFVDADKCPDDLKEIIIKHIIDKIKTIES